MKYIDEHVNEQMSKWVSNWAIMRVGESKKELVSKLPSKQIKKWTNKQVNKWAIE